MSFPGNGPGNARPDDRACQAMISTSDDLARVPADRRAVATAGRTRRLHARDARLSLRCRRVVHYEHGIEDAQAPEQGTECLVRGVRQVGVARGGVRERQLEYVRESLVEILRAVVHAVLHREDAGNLLLERGERFGDLPDLLRARVGLET